MESSLCSGLSMALEFFDDSTVVGMILCSRESLCVSARGNEQPRKRGVACGAAEICQSPSEILHGPARLQEGPRAVERVPAQARARGAHQKWSFAATCPMRGSLALVTTPKLELLMRPLGVWN